MGMFDDIPSAGETATESRPRSPTRIEVRPLDTRARDLVVKTIYGEAAQEPPEGQAAVAAVIRNRLESGRFGDSVPRVVLSPNQFEPWNTQAGRSRMAGLRPDSPQYQAIGDIVDQVFGGSMDDPTQGATHFFSPTAQAALGRQPPRWASGQEPLNIGRHAFYAPDGALGVTDASAQARMPANAAARTSTGFAPDSAPTPAASGMFDDIQPVAQGDAFNDRFAPRQAPENAKALSAALEQRANSLTTGPRLGGGDSFAVSQGNQLAAAEQGASPVVAQRQNIVSTEVHQGDDGGVYYRDPATGQMAPTDAKRHVVLRDPADGRFKVYARTADTNAGPLEGLSRVMSQGMLAGAPTARPAVAANLTQRSPSIEQIKGAARVGYQSPEVAAVEIKSSALTDLSKKIQAELTAAGFDKNTAPKTVGVLQSAAEAPTGAVVTAQNLQSLRKTLGKAAQSADPAERAAASSAMRSLDEFMGSIPESATLAGNPERASQILSEANANWSAAKHAEGIDQKMVRAVLRAQSANSGMNVANTIRQRLADILLNPKLKRGFTPEELEQMETIVKGTMTQNVLRGAGNMMGGGGGFGAVAAATAGAYATGGVGVVIPVVGYLVKRLGNSLAMKDVENLSAAIRLRSPLGQSIGNSLEAWNKYAELAAKNPQSPRLNAMLTVTARNLSNNLKDAGINVSPAMLQGPMRGAAQEEEPKPERVIDAQP